MKSCGGSASKDSTGFIGMDRIHRDSSKFIAIHQNARICAWWFKGESGLIIVINPDSPRRRTGITPHHPESSGWCGVMPVRRHDCSCTCAQGHLRMFLHICARTCANMFLRMMFLLRKNIMRKIMLRNVLVQHCGTRTTWCHNVVVTKFFDT